MNPKIKIDQDKPLPVRPDSINSGASTDDDPLFKPLTGIRNDKAAVLTGASPPPPPRRAAPTPPGNAIKKDGVLCVEDGRVSRRQSGVARRPSQKPRTVTAIRRPHGRENRHRSGIPISSLGSFSSQVEDANNLDDEDADGLDEGSAYAREYLLDCLNDKRSPPRSPGTNDLLALPDLLRKYSVGTPTKLNISHDASEAVKNTGMPEFGMSPMSRPPRALLYKSPLRDAVAHRCEETPVRVAPVSQQTGLTGAAPTYKLPENHGRNEENAPRFPPTCSGARIIFPEAVRPKHNVHNAEKMTEQKTKSRQPQLAEHTESPSMEPTSSGKAPLSGHQIPAYRLPEAREPEIPSQSNLTPTTPKAPTSELDLANNLRNDETGPFNAPVNSGATLADPDITPTRAEKRASGKTAALTDDEILQMTGISRVSYSFTCNSISFCKVITG
jgi:hypothetical protein